MTRTGWEKPLLSVQAAASLFMSKTSGSVHTERVCASSPRRQGPGPQEAKESCLALKTHQASLNLKGRKAQSVPWSHRLLHVPGSLVTHGYYRRQGQSEAVMGTWTEQDLVHFSLSLLTQAHTFLSQSLHNPLTLPLICGRVWMCGLCGCVGMCTCVRVWMCRRVDI